jgi:hypothetical protein
MTSPTLTRPLIRTRWPAAIRTLGPPAVLVLGLCTWALGVGQLRPPAIGSYGLLASANPWFLLGLGMVVSGFLIELHRSAARGWVLGLGIVAVIVAIHATVPILYGTPEYAWVYKHIGVALALGQNGRVTDPSSIYQLWPALFAATASLGALGHVGPLTFATWAPLAFELADALVLLAVFRVLSGNRRVAYLAVLLYEGLIAWVGQDYLSPQAFAYLLWLGVVLILARWLRRPAPVEPRGRLGRLRAPVLAGLEPPPPTSRRRRAVAIVLVAVIFLVIVAAHQLTPYIALTGVGALVVLGLIRPWWLVVVLAAIAGGYLIPRYGLIAHDFGGLFSGGNPIQNASGSRGTHHAGAEATTALIVRGLAAGMWLLALAAIALRRRSLGRVAFAAGLAFSPFVVLVAQSYGGEAVYRVYLFSAPWCALLIAGAVYELRRPQLRWIVVGGVCGAALLAGLQGLYGPVAVNAVMPDELAASGWLYTHTPPGSLIVLAADNFPALDTADYNARQLEVMPADPQIGEAWLDEGNVSEVESWIAGLGHQSAYVVVSHGMAAYADYFGAPTGFTRLAHGLPTAPGWTVVYRNADVTIYRLTVR